MELPTPFNPDIQRYFKLSDLAGKRWPNVTEEDIFNWHDASFVPAFPPFRSPLKDLLKELWPEEELPESARLAFEECLDETGELAPIIDTIKEIWPQEDVPRGVIGAMETLWLKLSIPDSLEDALIAFWEENTNSLAGINLMGFWAFFAELRSFLSEEEISLASDWQKRIYDITPVEFLPNSFYRLTTDSVKGFSFNKQGNITFPVVFDEEGKPHCVAELNEESGEWVPGQVEIKKEDLLVKASSVRLIEQIVPEITSPGFQADKKNILPPTSEASADDIRAKIRSDKRKENTDLVTIGALISLLKDETDFKTNVKIIDAILGRHEKVYGLKERTLQGRFSDAKEALKNTTRD